MSHEVVLVSDEDGWIIAECPGLPGCISQAKNEAEAFANIQEAIAGWLWAENLKATDPQN
jgi:predicted RNase H-like HicB family nuclease